MHTDSRDESLVKISGSSIHSSVQQPIPHFFFPDTQTILFILCRFKDRTCNLITVVHLRVLSLSLCMRMLFATILLKSCITVLPHLLVILSKKETGLDAHDLFPINMLAAFYPLIFLWVCR